jgi:uncharacterized protein with PQ loop repeat
MIIHPHHHARNKKTKTSHDFLVYFFMVATPLFELPQAYSIYKNQDASGVSIWTWGFFSIASVVWFSYGLRHKLMPLIVTYSLYFIIEAVIVVGIIKYS